MDTRRLFWGFEVLAQWPQFPQDGRIIEPASRHATMVFLGDTDHDILKPFIENYKPGITAAPTGYFDHIMFLPNKRKARVISLGGKINEMSQCVGEVQRLKRGMEALGLRTEEREWLFHVTVARAPFRPELWESMLGERSGLHVPFRLVSISLYQSMPNLTYKKLHSLPLMC
jgi:RNA 2',3'-cyclic 3'-phosphodiesterase